MFRKEYILLLIAVCVSSLSIALFRVIDWGTDSFTSFNLALSNQLNFRFGTIQMMINSLLFTLLLRKQATNFVLGTILNLFLIGYISDVFYKMLIDLEEISENSVIKIILSILALILLIIGISFYMVSNFLGSPYDILGLYISETVHISYSWCRLVSDVFLLIVSHVLGEKIAYNTVFISLFLGPGINWFQKN